MHPGMMAWWKHRRESGGCGARASAEFGGGGGCGPGGGGWRGRGEHGDGESWHSSHGEDDLGGGTFGVRRPLRFLAYKLELNEDQVTQLASILSDLKTERAQAAVDHRRTTSAFADALAGEAFDQTKVSGAAGDRVKIAERLREAVVQALAKIHALLDAQQRAKLAYLIRTGALSI